MRNVMHLITCTFVVYLVMVLESCSTDGEFSAYQQAASSTHGAYAKYYKYTKN